MNSISCFFRYPFNRKAPFRARETFFLSQRSQEMSHSYRRRWSEWRRGGARWSPRRGYCSNPFVRNSSVTPAVAAVRQPSCHSPARRMMQARLFCFFLTVITLCPTARKTLRVVEPPPPSLPMHFAARRANKSDKSPQVQKGRGKKWVVGGVLSTASHAPRHPSFYGRIMCAHMKHVWPGNDG